MVDEKCILCHQKVCESNLSKILFFKNQLCRGTGFRFCSTLFTPNLSLEDGKVRCTISVYLKYFAPANQNLLCEIEPKYFLLCSPDQTLLFSIREWISGGFQRCSAHSPLNQYRIGGEPLWIDRFNICRLWCSIFDNDILEYAGLNQMGSVFASCRPS